MKDLDFDELDRAVNSLVGGSEPAPSEPVLNVPTTAPNSDVSIQVPDRPVVQPLAARRSSGRFMDVVHPSSDMRSSAPVASVSPVSRTAPAIQPLVVTPPVVSETTLPVQDAPKMEYPDPIDFQGFTPGVTPEPVNELAPAQDDEDSDIAKIADDITASLGKETTTPLESPFIADAKVEKRPLGAFSVGIPATVTPLAAEMVATSPDVELPDTEQKGEIDDHPIEKDVPLPAELQNDLLSIEANENPAPEALFTPPVSSTDVPVGPTSIPQQYTEKPSTGDQPAATMFAAEAYKKPAGHAKKKSGWFVVLWIALLVIVGGGIGAAVYFFVLPML